MPALAGEAPHVGEVLRFFAVQRSRPVRRSGDLAGDLDPASGGRRTELITATDRTLSEMVNEAVKRVLAYRVRQGDYRIVYSIVDLDLIVWVVKVGHRKDVYR